MTYFIPFDMWELRFLSSCSNHQRVCGFSQSMLNIGKLLSDIMPAKNTELSWHQNSGVGLNVNPLCGQVSIKFQVPTRWLLKYKVFNDYIWAKLWSINAFSVSRQSHITLFSFSNDTAAFSLPLSSPVVTIAIVLGVIAGIVGTILLIYYLINLIIKVRVQWSILF